MQLFLGVLRFLLRENLRFEVYELGNSSGKKCPLIESSQAKVPVLLNNDDETVEVAWRESLQKDL